MTSSIKSTLKTIIHLRKQYREQLLDSTEPHNLKLPELDSTLSQCIERLSTGDIDVFFYPLSLFPTSYPQEICLAAITPRQKSGLVALKTRTFPTDALPDEPWLQSLSEKIDSETRKNQSSDIVILESQYIHVPEESRAPIMDLNIKAYVPPAGHNVGAAICRQTDLKTRTLLAAQHDTETGNLTNQERKASAQMISTGKAPHGAHAYRDQAGRYVLDLSWIEEDEIKYLTVKHSTFSTLSDAVPT